MEYDIRMIGYVKIEQCSHGGWYRDLVGQWYPVYRDEDVEWETYELTGHKNYILKEDATNVTNGKTTKEQ